MVGERDALGAQVGGQAGRNLKGVSMLVPGAGTLCRRLEGNCLQPHTASKCCAGNWPRTHPPTHHPPTAGAPQRGGAPAVREGAAAAERAGARPGAVPRPAGRDSGAQAQGGRQWSKGGEGLLRRWPGSSALACMATAAANTTPAIVCVCGCSSWGRSQCSPEPMQPDAPAPHAASRRWRV